MSPRIFGVNLLPALGFGLCLACGDDTTSRGDDSVSGRRLQIPEALELCAVSPVRFDPAFDDSAVFAYRGVLTLGDGAALELELGDSASDPAPGWVPFDLRVAPDGVQHISGSMGEGAAWVEAGVVPSTLYRFEEVAGYDTAVYVDPTPVADLPAAALVKERVVIEVANMVGDDLFNLSALTQLDAEKRLYVYGFVAGVTSNATSSRALMAPCQVDDPIVDRYDLTLAEGTVSFHTRPARWLLFDGFTTLAEGQVDGIEFSVNRYWDLEYSSGEVGLGGLYGSLPVMGVRFGEQADGSCSLVVEEDAMAFDGSFKARLLDCEGGLVRELTVESVDIVVGGGSPAPMSID